MNNQTAGDRRRTELIDLMASADGQSWPRFWEDAAQRQIGETMYGQIADEILASSWIASERSAAFERGCRSELSRLRTALAREKLAALIQAELDSDITTAGTVGFAEYFGERCAAAILDAVLPVAGLNGDTE